MSPKFAAVAFDLDGTLYPNRSLYLRLAPFVLSNARFLRAFNGARNAIRREQEANLSLARPDFYEHQAGLVAKILGKSSGDTMRKIDALMYRGLEPLFSGIRLFPHVRELLRELRAAGTKLGMLSDFPPEAKLENMGLGGIWDAALCSERTGALKPSPIPFNSMADALGVEPARILYVGNSRPYDVSGALRAGMKAALISKTSRGNPKADFTFHDYRQLRAFVLN